MAELERKESDRSVGGYKMNWKKVRKLIRKSEESSRGSAEIERRLIKEEVCG